MKTDDQLIAEAGFLLESDGDVFSPRRVDRDDLLKLIELVRNQEVEQELEILLLDLQAMDKEGHARQSARYFMLKIESWFDHQRLTGINTLLRLFDPMAHSEVSTVALLRSTFRVKDKLSEWQPLLDRARVALATKIENTDEVLKGL